MLVTYHQLVIIKFMEKREKSSFHVGYVKGITPFTFVPIWMKPKELDNRPTSLQQFPSRYMKISLNPSLVDELTDQNQPSVETTLSERNPMSLYPTQINRPR